MLDKIINNVKETRREYTSIIVKDLQAVTLLYCYILY